MGLMAVQINIENHISSPVHLGPPALRPAHCIAAEARDDVTVGVAELPDLTTAEIWTPVKCPARGRRTVDQLREFSPTAAHNPSDTASGNFHNCMMSFHSPVSE